MKSPKASSQSLERNMQFGKKKGWICGFSFTLGMGSGRVSYGYLLLKYLYKTSPGIQGF
jgi:hypothetical protein